jgi:UPF0755 protein
MNNKSKKKQKSSILRTFSYVLLLVFGIFLWLSWLVFKPSVLEKAHIEEKYIHIDSQDSFDDLLMQIEKEKILQNTGVFILLSKLTDYKDNIRPGRYFMHKGMSLLSMLRTLKGGRNVPVKLVINALDKQEELCGLLGDKLEPDSMDFLHAFTHDTLARHYGFNTETFVLMIIPNTYEFYWNTSVQGFLKKMQAEYERFWTETRRKKARSLRLTPVEVAILASIVQKESNKKEELSTIAGVYLNRLNRNMALQADPTVEFVLRNKNLRRIYKSHTQTESPYNTYQNTGLPPGPITLPQIFAIDAVLDAEEHNYLYFCAKSDMSGYHVFSRSYEQHKIYAREYRKKLNQLNIR